MITTIIPIITIIIITVKTISTNVAITILTRESEKVGGFCSYNSEKEENLPICYFLGASGTLNIY